MLSGKVQFHGHHASRPWTLGNQVLSIKKGVLSTITADGAGPGKLLQSLCLGLIRPTYTSPLARRENGPAGSFHGVQQWSRVDPQPNYRQQTQGQHRGQGQGRPG